MQCERTSWARALLRLSALVAGVVASGHPSPEASNWPGDPSESAPICIATGEQESQQVVTDGSGGAIIAWSDERTGERDIYAQRIDGEGRILWAEDGVLVCDADEIQWSPLMVPDGFGGAILTWSDQQSGSTDIYAQRIDTNGDMLWTPNGVPVSLIAPMIKGVWSQQRGVRDISMSSHAITSRPTPSGGGIRMVMDMRFGSPLRLQR